MKRYITLWILLMVVMQSARSQQASPFTKAVYIAGADTLPYRLLYPLHYDQHKKYPVVLFLHGAGQRGSDNKKTMTGVPTVLTDSIGREKYSCFIVVPQCARADVWVKFPHFPQSLQATDQPTPSARAVLGQLDQMLKQLPIDKKRIYMMGYSMGGEGTFDLLTRRPELFAAAIPICSVADTALARRIAGIPIWAFHGDMDEVNDVKYSRMMVAALKQQNGHPIYTEIPGGKHNIWITAYAEPGLFDWLFAQKRK